MKNLVIILILLVFISLSCEKGKVEINPDNLLLGTWVYSEWENDASVYVRKNEFADNQCYRFNSDGTLTERKNSGWCGTPPITYADYDGTWSVINDTLVSVTAGYWGGTTTYKMDIEEIGPRSMKVIFLYDR
jgi:hypothetical protein